MLLLARRGSAASRRRATPQTVERGVGCDHCPEGKAKTQEPRGGLVTLRDVSGLRVVTVLVVVVTAVALQLAPAASTAERRCEISHSHVAVSNDYATLYTRRYGNDNRVLYACLRGGNRRVYLSSREGGAIVYPGQAVALRGYLVAYGLDSHSAEAPEDLSMVYVIDIRRPDHRLLTLLRPSGTVARMTVIDARTVIWTGCSRQARGIEWRCRVNGAPTRVRVYKHDAGTEESGGVDVIDQGPDVAATSLQVRGRLAEWRHGDEVRSTTLAP
jgi:hypothetical protein